MAWRSGPDALLDGMVEVDESYYGGRGKPESRGRGMANANKSLLVLAVEKVAVAPGKGVEASGFVAGRARLAILPRANAEQLGGFVRAAVTPGARLLTDDFKGYAGLGAVYQHQPTVQGQGKNAETQMPIIHVLFSNLKTWLNGTYHGVSAKHLPRYGPGMGLSLQPPPADRRPRRLRPEPRHGPANHHIPPVDPRLATPGRTTCLNRIGDDDDSTIVAHEELTETFPDTIR